MPRMTQTIAASASAQAILLQAIRCWVIARKSGLPGQPTLARSIFRVRSAILVPCLDSLMTFYELALGRRIGVGETADPTDDEERLLMMVAGARSRNASLSCGEAAGSRLDRAIRSTQIMLGLTMTDDAALSGMR